MTNAQIKKKLNRLKSQLASVTAQEQSIKAQIRSIKENCPHSSFSMTRYGRCCDACNIFPAMEGVTCV